MVEPLEIQPNKIEPRIADIPLANDRVLGRALELAVRGRRDDDELVVAPARTLRVRLENGPTRMPANSFPWRPAI